MISQGQALEGKVAQGDRSHKFNYLPSCCLYRVTQYYAHCNTQSPDSSDCESIPIKTNTFIVIQDRYGYNFDEKRRTIALLFQSPLQLT